MGPYQQVRASSPSNERQSRLAIELEDQLQGEKSPALGNEESERLLPGGQDAGDGNKLKESDSPSRTQGKWPRLSQNKPLRWALCGLAGIALLWIAVSLLSHWAAKETERRTAKFRRPSAEYIIPRNWDYDAHPKARYQRWSITDITANPDGVYRPLTVINGKFPGPMIVCNEGDTIVVDVTNHAKNATSIHWHGLFQNGTNFMDGTVGATQCPIAPGETFRYQFTVKGQAGSCKCASLLPCYLRNQPDSNLCKTFIMAIKPLLAWMDCMVPW